MARRPVWLERSEMMGRPGKERVRREGGSYSALEVITGAPQDSCMQLCNVHSSQPGQ